MCRGKGLGGVLGKFKVRCESQPVDPRISRASFLLILRGGPEGRMGMEHVDPLEEILRCFIPSKDCADTPRALLTALSVLLWEWHRSREKSVGVHLGSGGGQQ